MRQSLKFLHTIGAIGLMGSMACLLVLMTLTPGDPAGVALLSRAMGRIATWVFFPSLGLTLLAGLLAIAVNRGFHNATWAWVKLATGVLVFEGGFVSVLGPLQRAAEQEPGTADAAGLAATRGTIWVLLGIAAVNVVLGVWRPRFRRRSG